MKMILVLLWCLVFTATGGSVVRADIVVAWAGQSLCAAMFTDNGVYVAPNPYTYMWDPSTMSWTTVNGAGAREYANMLSTQSGQPVYMINGCVNGSSIAQWIDQSPGTPLTIFKALVANSGKTPDIIQWNQGQTDYNGTGYWTYYNSLAWLYPHLLSTWGRTSSQLPMNIWISGLAGPGFGSSQNVNAAQLAFATSWPGARLGAAYYDLTYVDGTHVDAASYRIMGDRQARLDLKGLGVSGFYCSATPRILGGWRLTSNVIELITDSPCGLHTHSWASSLTGWEVYNADFSWNIPIAVAWLAGSSFGTSIYINTAASTASNVWVFFMRDQWQNPSAPPFANDTSLGVNGNPVAPLPFGLQTPN